MTSDVRCHIEMKLLTVYMSVCVPYVIPRGAKTRKYKFTIPEKKKKKKKKNTLRITSDASCHIEMKLLTVHVGLKTLSCLFPPTGIILMYFNVLLVT